MLKPDRHLTLIEFLTSPMQLTKNKIKNIETERQDQKP